LVKFKLIRLSVLRKPPLSSMCSSRVSISHQFFCFAKHETKRNKKVVSRTFVCFAKHKKQRNFVSFSFVKGKIPFRFVNFF
jgi:hypothetical protein